MRNFGKKALGLLQAGSFLLVPHQAIEDGEDLFTIGINALQGFAERLLEIACLEPFIQHGGGDVDILAQCFYGVAAQEQAIEKCRLPLWG